VSINAAWFSQFIVGLFWGINVLVNWKDSAIETALKMVYSLISALTTELGS